MYGTAYYLFEELGLKSKVSQKENQREKKKEEEQEKKGEEKEEQVEKEEEEKKLSNVPGDSNISSSRVASLLTHFVKFELAAPTIA